MADLTPPGVIPVDVDALIRTCHQLADAFNHVAELFATASRQMVALAAVLDNASADGPD